MPRYYRRRTTRVVKPKKKWATNIRNVRFDTLDDTTVSLAASQVGAARVLCANSIEVDDGLTVSPTPTIVKTGNYKIQCDASVTTSSAVFVRLMLYIMYIPEGVFIPSSADTPKQRYEADFISLKNIVNRHPEWILAWRQFGADFINSSANLERVSFSSRLKRNLNSGDQICAVILANEDVIVGEVGPITRVMINGTCQFWTCNN